MRVWTTRMATIRAAVMIEPRAVAQVRLHGDDASDPREQAVAEILAARHLPLAPCPWYRFVRDAGAELLDLWGSPFPEVWAHVVFAAARPHCSQELLARVARDRELRKAVWAAAQLQGAAGVRAVLGLA